MKCVKYSLYKVAYMKICIMYGSCWVVVIPEKILTQLKFNKIYLLLILWSNCGTLGTFVLCDQHRNGNEIILISLHRYTTFLRHQNAIRMGILTVATLQDG
jgi:hypothetical protein